MDRFLYMSLQEMRRQALSYRCFAFTLLLGVFVNVCAGNDLSDGLTALSQGSFEKAAGNLSRFAADNPEHPSIAQASAGAGHAFASLGKHREALGMFEQALKKNSDRRKEPTLRLACAKCALAIGKFSEAAEHALTVVRSGKTKREREAAYPLLVSALCKDGRCGEAWQAVQDASANDSVSISGLKSLASHIGSSALNQGHANTARDAFAWQMQRSEPGDDEQAAIGYAWAQAALATSSADAAKALVEFVDSHPQSSGASRALLAAAKKLLEQDMGAESIKVLKRLTTNYPNAREVPEALDLTASLAEKLGNASLAKESRIRLARDYRTTEHGQKVLHLVLAEAAASGDDALFERIATEMLMGKREESLESTIAKVQAVAGDEVVQRFAIIGLQRLVTPEQHHITSPIVSWLFRQKQWRTIAQAASELPAAALSSDPKQGSMIAESLFRVGNLKESYAIFDMLAERKDAPFIVLLRRAELAVQLDSVANATEAVRVALEKSGSKRDQQYVQIIAAQLEIRSAQFDHARQRLDEVVRSAASDDALRGRAQWLIGETHYMQQQYGPAIESYSRCESLFPESGWAPAALLQAGKAFEKLGDFGNAVVCYKNLLQKHLSSPHARIAAGRVDSIEKETKR